MAKVKRSHRTEARYRDLPTHNERMTERRWLRGERVSYYTQRNETVRAHVTRFAAYWRAVYATHGLTKAQRRNLKAAVVA